jgi:hypothetical protein
MFHNLALRHGAFLARLMASINMTLTDPELSGPSSFIALHVRIAMTLMLCARWCEVSDNLDGDYAGEPSGIVSPLNAAETRRTTCQTAGMILLQGEHDAVNRT